MIIAHEFFDALPIHLFECTSNGWREVMVDIDDTENRQYHNFRLIVAPGPTRASIALTGSLAYKKFKIGDRIEISPDSMKISKQIAKHIKDNGGASLIIDYGQDFIQGNTLRAIKQHEFVHPLSDPGQADLSADVDFCYLKESVTDLAYLLLVDTYGPITQSKFLQSLGIKARLLMLLKNALPAQHKDLISSTERLVHPSAMGEIYKVLSFVPKGSLEAPMAFEKSKD
ncbi:34657_t:CDS:2 [Racocetra persica]|uniref:34657_t:CDS:1 n=1 Tax=Racocetra persica TaxID=160502 RepID=A0ACA9KQY9_9GLOM|nr:34657_t:CDS:2 [Racocetra persica]